MTLADLIARVKAEDGVTLETIANRAGLPLATVGAYANGTRGTKRPPTPEALAKLAKGLRRPEAVVFEAAGRTHPSQLADGEGEGIYIARLYGDLSDRDKQVVRDLLTALRRQQTRDAG